MDDRSDVAELTSNERLVGDRSDGARECRCLDVDAARAPPLKLQRAHDRLAEMSGASGNENELVGHDREACIVLSICHEFASCGRRDRSRIAYRVPLSAAYCSSLTFSIQSTTLPFSDSLMAMCCIAVVAVAPCQCFSPGSNHTTSPGRTSSIAPPSRCTRPRPNVMMSVWPSGCVCHAVRAPGSKVTALPAARAGALAPNRGFDAHRAGEPVGRTLHG